MRPIVQLVAAATLWTSFSGCGDNRPVPWSATSFCAELAARVCDGFVACDCDFSVRPYSASTCVSARTAACEADLAVVATPAIAAGTLRFDDAQVGPCLAAISSRVGDCRAPAEQGPWPIECSGILVATANIGETCELAGALYCAGGSGLCFTEDEASAICTQRAAAGDACLAGDCAPGLVCGGGVDPQAPSPTCKAPSPAGASCLADFECAPSLVCRDTGMCGTPGGVGATCTAPSQCAIELGCVDGLCQEVAGVGSPCDSSGVCGNGYECGRHPEGRVCDDPAGLGAACDAMSCDEAFHCDAQTMLCIVLPGQGQPCADGFACAAGLGCADGVGTCEVLPLEGQPCASGQRFCADGLGCRDSDQTCQLPAAAGLGEVCLLNPPDVLCADGLGCDFGANGSICRAKTGVGGVCNTDRTCEASTYCEFSTLTCTPRLADGAPCEDGNECLASSTCAQTPQGPRCTPIPGRDEPCEEACVDDLACQGAGGLCTPSLCVAP